MLTPAVPLLHNGILPSLLHFIFVSSSADSEKLSTSRHHGICLVAQSYKYRKHFQNC